MRLRRGTGPLPTPVKIVQHPTNTNGQLNRLGQMRVQEIRNKNTITAMPAGGSNDRINSTDRRVVRNNGHHDSRKGWLELEWIKGGNQMGERRAQLLALEGTPREVRFSDVNSILRSLGSLILGETHEGIK